MDDDDDDEMGTPPLEDPLPREHSLPPHIHNATSYMRNASPPIQVVPNGVPYQRQHTPQAQMVSRPGSRNSVPNVRRMSGNLGPGPSHLQQVSQAPQAANGYAYTRQTPSMYNPQAAQGMPVAPHHPQQHAQQAQYYSQLQHAAAPHPQVQQAYLQEQRRQSLPPAFPQHERQQPQQQHMPSPPQPQPEREQSHDDQSNRLQQPQPAKSRSIFTPIDDSRSLLAQHWGVGKSTTEPKPEIKRENEPQSEARIQASKPTSSSRLQREVPVPRRTNSTEFPPPSRSNTAQSNEKRPRLKVQIPEEKSDADSATASSPRQSAITTSDTPAKSTEASHSSGTGVVLPPPSPSASAILSAGASGPPNPFARPHPPGGPAQGQSYSSNNNIETPISALPSRLMADGLLPSPSTFYPEWFGRSGGDSNLLPSPLNLQTPVMGGSNFRDEDGERKRKSPDQDGQEAAKRIKT